MVARVAGVGLIGVGSLACSAAWRFVLGLDDGGHSCRVGLPPHVLGVRKLVVFFVLHSPILEPNFDLSF